MAFEMDNQNRVFLSKKNIFVFCGVACSLLFLFTVPRPAQAQQSVILNPMPFTAGDRGYGMRMHPIKKVMKMHNGQDYPVPIGTNVPYQGSYQSCKPNNGGAGNMATVANACGVTQIFMHLRECGPSTIISGNTGGSTGPHLHYEIHINGTPVDPMKAFGKDLCTESVRRELLEDAKNNGAGSGGGGAAANSNAPEPPPQNVDHVTYVPPGGINPHTGIPNTGTGYYYIEEPDGRIRVELELTSMGYNMPMLPPTTEDVVPTTTTHNSIAGCATDTWTAMVNQAVLQTRREATINSRYILKADTVMAYSCFEDGLKKVGENIGPIFSETNRWINKQIDIEGKTVTVNKELGDSSLDGAIQNVANYIFASHARANFKHGTLGGLYEISTGGLAEDEDSGQDGLPCGTMSQVWQMAKCMNLSDDPLFPTFEELITPESDPRKYPANMSCNNTGITQGMIEKARQKGVANVDMHFDLLYRDASGNCAPPISTGVTVERQRGIGPISLTITYPDAVCPTLGCSYQNSGAGAGTCE